MTMMTTTTEVRRGERNRERGQLCDTHTFSFQVVRVEAVATEQSSPATRFFPLDYILYTY